MLFLRIAILLYHQLFLDLQSQPQIMRSSLFGEGYSTLAGSFNQVRNYIESSTGNFLKKKNCGIAESPTCAAKKGS